MKKKSILNLIRYHVENNDDAFRAEAYEIAYDFKRNGDEELAEYIFAQLSDANTFIPMMYDNNQTFFRKINTLETRLDPLPLPEEIKDDICEIVNAIAHDIGINKYLFYGKPGTGKTESAKQVSRILNRDLFVVNFDNVIDASMEQTSKNISEVFKEINNIRHPENVIILFDEIDAIGIDGTNSSDIKEMNSAASNLLKGLDNMNPNVVILATTNLYDSLDKALLKRFDKTISFDRYSREDLEEIAEIILEFYLSKFKYAGKNMRIFKKILKLAKTLPYPRDLKNIIKTSIAFSNLGQEFDYLRRFYTALLNTSTIDLNTLKEQGFSLREMEVMTKISKSQIYRDLQAKNNVFITTGKIEKKIDIDNKAQGEINFD